jgi:hypothetical protein
MYQIDMKTENLKVNMPGWHGNACVCTTYVCTYIQNSEPRLCIVLFLGQSFQKGYYDIPHYYLHPSI